MGYVSKYKVTFICFMNKKYQKHKVDFKTWDDYVLWLYYKHCNCNTMLYYRKLEKDIWDYSDWQTGSSRENEKKNSNWKKVEKDKYGFYKNDAYVNYLKGVDWSK